MTAPTKLCAEKEFLPRYRFTQEQFVSSKCEWAELSAIHDLHAASTGELQTAAGGVLERLRHVTEIHSLKLRVKNAEHLIAKIIRKKLEQPSLVVTRENYTSVITDLIGIRALHLFKDDWLAIDDFVRENWELKEEATAYYRDGDAENVLALFGARKCTVERHSFGYRSVHYLVKTQPTKRIYIAEIQVRTLFEEAWSEIDHRMRYPHPSTEAQLTEFLRIFNRLAGSADEMGTFIKNLNGAFEERTKHLDEATLKLQETQNELKKTVSRLNITEKERKALEKQLDSLRLSSATISAHTSPLTSAIPHAGSSVAALALFSAPRCRKCGSKLPLNSLAYGGECSKCQLTTSSGSIFATQRICSLCRTPFSPPTTPSGTITFGLGGEQDRCETCRNSLDR